MTTSPVTMESLAQAVGELQRQLSEAHSRIATQQNQLNAAAQKVGALEQELSLAKNQAGSSTTANRFELNTPKKNKPTSFNGKGSVSSWCVQMENYLGGNNDVVAMNIALSYLTGNAHEWWIVYSKSEEGENIHSWQGLVQNPWKLETLALSLKSRNWIKKKESAACVKDYVSGAAKKGISPKTAQKARGTK